MLGIIKALTEIVRIDVSTIGIYLIFCTGLEDRWGWRPTVIDILCNMFYLPVLNYIVGYDNIELSTSKTLGRISIIHISL